MRFLLEKIIYHHYCRSCCPVFFFFCVHCASVADCVAPRALGFFQASMVFLGVSPFVSFFVLLYFPLFCHLSSQGYDYFSPPLLGGRFGGKWYRAYLFGFFWISFRHFSGTFKNSIIFLENCLETCYNWKEKTQFPKNVEMLANVGIF